VTDNERVDIPARAPDDAVMAGEGELRAAREWANGVFMGQGGSSHPLLAADGPPLSFLYDGTPSTDLLPSWGHSAEGADAEGCNAYEATWTDPRTHLRLNASVVTHERYPAVDWLLRFTNDGPADTPILERVQALDVLLRAAPDDDVVLHRINGDSCGAVSFLPVETRLAVGDGVSFAPVGGRSSNGAFPFFNVQVGGRGVIVGLGWSGQWAASVERDPSGAVRVRGGMELTHLHLHPGESIRAPRILIMPWEGDRAAAHNRFRRLMLFRYVPREGGAPVRMPTALQTFDRYSRAVPEWATEAGQLAACRFCRQVGCDTLWLDAAWFPGGFPDGVGTWSHKPREFPRGLGPIGRACHEAGMRFVVWFEPERLGPGSQINREHPDFVHGGPTGGLYRLGDPEARRWLTDLLSARIAEYGIDVYRNDFNTDPLSIWRSADAPDRQGMTEIRYIEGLYEMWDELLARHPGLLIDNCSSGGRRIDLETCTRSVPLWRSDTNCSPGAEHWNQAHAMGIGMYVPLSTACAWSPDAYTVRSTATAGLITQFDYLAPDFPLQLAQRTLAEACLCAPFWYGDMYPLTPCAVDDDALLAFQLHRADLGAGIVLAFRRELCPESDVTVRLRALDAQARYDIELIDDALGSSRRSVVGGELAAGLSLSLTEGPSSLLVRYSRAGDDTT